MSTVNRNFKLDSDYILCMLIANPENVPEIEIHNARLYKIALKLKQVEQNGTI